MKSVTLQSRDFQHLLGIPSNVTFDVLDHGWTDTGGPEAATIAVNGPASSVWRALEWLRCPIDIDSDEAGRVWWGYVHEVEITAGAWTVGVSLDGMSNRIKVVYNEPVLYGSAAKKETSWVQDDDSVATYGYKELIQSISDVLASDAVRRRDQGLALLKYPQQLRRMTMSQNVSAQLRCRGWIGTLGWRYFTQAVGLDQHAVNGDKQHRLGVGFTATTIGFTKANKTLHDLEARLGNFKKDDLIRVTGSGAGNNGTYTVEQSTNRVQKLYTATTLSFGSGKITDSAKLLQDFNANDMVQVSGSVAANNKVYRVVSAAADGSWIQLDQSVTSAAAGANVTLKRGHHLVVRESLANDELPSASVTVQGYGEALRQSIIPNAGYVVGSLAVRGMKVGNPSDGLRISLYSDSGGNPFSVLLSVVVPAANLPTSISWIVVDTATTVTLVAGTRYHVVVERSGSLSASDYYQLAVDEALSYSGGEMRLKVASTWNTGYTRTPDADLPFKVIGKRETTAQIADMVAACGQFLVGTDMQQVSGVWSPQVRDGTQTAENEITKLLELGTASGARLHLHISPERWLQVHAESDQNRPYKLDSEGKLFDYLGNVVSLDVTPVGIWCEQDAIPTTINTTHLASLGLVYIEAHSVRDGKRSIRFRGQPNPFKQGVRHG